MTLHPQNPDSPIHKIAEDPRYGIADKHICASFVGPGTMGFNAGHLWNVDATDPQSVSEAMVCGRKQAAAGMHILHPATCSCPLRLKRAENCVWSGKMNFFDWRNYNGITAALPRLEGSGADPQL